MAHVADMADSKGFKELFGNRFGSTFHMNQFAIEILRDLPQGHMKAVVPGSSCKFGDADHPIEINVIYTVQTVCIPFDQNIVGSGIGAHARKNRDARFSGHSIYLGVEKNLGSFVVITDVDIVYLCLHSRSCYRHGSLVEGACTVNHNVNVLEGVYHAGMIVHVHLDQVHFFTVA